MRNLLIAALLLAGTLSAQVDRLGVIPYTLAGKTGEGDERIAGIMRDLTGEYMGASTYFDVLDPKQVKQAFDAHKLSFAQVQDWKQREKGIKGVAQDMNYIVVGVITFNKNELKISIAAELIRTRDGSTLRSAAVKGSKRILRSVALDLSRKLSPSKKEILKEIEQGYQRAYANEKYATAIKFCTWGLKIDPNLWKFPQMRARAHERYGAYARALDDYSLAVEKRGKATKSMKKDIKRIRSLLEDLKGKRTKLLGGIAKNLQQLKEENIFRRFRILYDVSRELSGKDKNKAKKIVQNARNVEARLSDLQDRLKKEKLAKASKNSNQKLEVFYKASEKILKDARAVLDSFASTFSKEAERYFSKAVKLYRRGRLKKAIIALDKTLLLTPKAANAYYWKAVTLGKLERYSQAVENFDLAIEYEPKNWESYYNRAKTYERLKEWEKALQDYRKTVELNKIADGFFGIAEMYRRLKKEKRALLYYNKTIECDKNYANAYFMRGKYYDQRARYVKARKNFNRALELDRNLRSKIRPLLAKIRKIMIKDSAIFAQKAKSLREDGEIKQAVDYYDKALKQDPDNTDSYFQRGFCWHLLGKYDKAVKDYTEAISLKRKAEFFYHRAIAYQHLKKYDKALEDLDKTLGFNTFFHEAHQRRGIIFEEKELYQEAVKSYKQAIKMAGNKAYYYTDLARVYRKMKKEGDFDFNWQRARSTAK